ncbi:MAG: C-terminal helicase domain-containing protein, partial [Rubritalea sp.]|uniref:C-terminal helicase domain-containing protein n=1 Tax=Rubritalea sp. TaxID=2109375 RepID=UPI0032427C34
MSDNQQYIYEVFEQQKHDLLFHLLKQNSAWKQVLVFRRTREGVHELASELNKGSILTESLHGKQKQEIRDRSIANFKAEKCRVLVVTDALARAIDWTGTAVVINYEFPELEEDYITRASAVSTMFTFVTPQNGSDLEQLEAQLEAPIET